MESCHAARRWRSVSFPKSRLCRARWRQQWYCVDDYVANTKAFDASDGSSAKVFLGSSPEGLYFHGKNYDDHGSSSEGLYSTGFDCITKAFDKQL